MQSLGVNVPSIVVRYWSYIVGGLIVHFAFNRFEPRTFKTRFALLLGTPILISLLTHGFDPLAPLVAIGILNTCLVISLIIYRRNPWHPLAAHPGPTLASITNLWMAYQVSGGKRHAVLRTLHEKYGTHVRIGPNMLSIVDVDVVTKLLHDPQVPRSTSYRTLEPDHMPGHIISSRSINAPNPLQTHAKNRETWSKGFTSAALEDFNVPLFNRLAQLLEELKHRAESRSEVDLDEWFKCFIWDFMGDLVFGGGFSMIQDGGDKSGFSAILEESLVAQTPLVYMPWINNVIPYLAALGDGQRKILQFADKCILERSRRPLAFKDLFYFFAKEEEPEHLRPSKAAIVNDTFIGIGAGADTTYLTLSFLFFFLLSHPDKLRTLREEIDSLEEEEATNLSRVAQLPYLNACIDETLRLAPPIPTQMSRAPSSGSGKIIAGRYVPDDTTVYISSLLLGRDPRYFYPEPTAFLPERWLATEKKANPDIIHNTQAFIAFSTGITSCLGKQLAYRELRLATVTLLRNFNMKLVLKDGVAGPPGIDELLFDRISDWGTFNLGKGLIKVTLENRV
ncbi:cytochrome P450 [Flagelloscypha sp. PMI_526]|nr:cytochrome P450 [Flagelloscypha sp. PMI_526]